MTKSYKILFIYLGWNNVLRQEGMWKRKCSRSLHLRRSRALLHQHHVRLHADRRRPVAEVVQLSRVQIVDG